MSQLKRGPATLAALALLALSSGCGDSPTEPKPLGAGVLAPGALVRGTIQSLADTARYSLVLNQGTDAMIYLMAKGDWLRLEVRDSTGQLVTVTSDAHNTTSPERRATMVIPASRYRYHVDVSMVQGTAPSDYEIRVVAASRAPERIPPTLTVGPVISGEDLDHAYDVDTFTVSVDRDQIVNLFLRKTIRSASVVTARIIDPNLLYYPVGTSAAEGDTVLGLVGSGRVTLTAGVVYTIRVAYDMPDTARTPYELQLRKVDAAPESAPAVLVPGDTIHESIDYLGDFDEFTLNGAPGAKYNLFAEAGGDPPHEITAELLAVNASEPSITALAGGAPLAGNATGVFTLPSNGTLKVRVTDGAGFARGHLGPYRLFVYPIDSGTESAAAALALDRVTSGRIEMLGDVDEFTLAVGSDSLVNIEVRRPDEPAGRPLRFTLLTAGDSEITEEILGIGYPAAVDTIALGTQRMGPGTYKVRVEPTSSRSGGFAGAYEVLPHSIATSPEHVAGTIALGDTIRAERLDVPGDVDRFHVPLTAGDSVYLTLAGLPDGVGAKAYLYRTSDGRFFGGTDVLGGLDSRSRIIVISSTGDYYVEVSGRTAGVQQAETGSYQLALDRISTAPETGPSTIALGDTIAGWIETPGDVDDFTVTAPAGTEITGWFRDSTDYGYCCIAVEFIDPATGAVVKQSPPNAEGLGRVTVPAGGSLRLRVREPYTCDAFGCYGPNIRASYRLSLTAVNRAPESRAAAFALGDTVNGEWIDPAGDIDEFTFAAAAGDTVNVYFQTPMGTWGYEGLTMTLVDPATGATLGTLTSNNPTANLEDIALTRVVLPSTGSYMVRVAGTNDTYNKGAYRFRVARPGQ